MRIAAWCEFVTCLKYWGVKLPEISVNFQCGLCIGGGIAYTYCGINICAAAPQPPCCTANFYKSLCGQYWAGC